MNADFGKRSYEYAIGCFKASPRQPLSEDQWTRLRNSDRKTAESLLSEYGFPAVNEERTPVDSIEQDMASTVAFIRANAPDQELTNLLFFEEDALNLKILVKAHRMGIDNSSLSLTEGGFPTEILDVCARTEDFSLLGKDLEESLSRIPEIKSPCELSCVIDTAMYLHSLKEAKKCFSKAFYKLLLEYGKGRNRLTLSRLRTLGKSPEDYFFALFPVDMPEGVHDENKSSFDIMNEVKKSFDSIVNELSFDEGMGFIARYYFLKKNDASALRLLFANNDFAGGAGNE